MHYEIDQTHFTLYETSEYTTILDFFTAFKQNKKNQYLYISNRQILLDGKPVTNKLQTVNQKPITVLFEKQQIDWPLSKYEADICYINDFFLVAHKDAGYIIHDSDDTNCLNARVATYLHKHNISTPIRPLHRLDKDTTGLVLYSLIPFFQPLLDDQMETKQIHRTYDAIVFGHLQKGKQFTIHAPIAKDRHQNNKYRIHKTGKDACTHCNVIDYKDGYNIIQCELETGRTHQIRVHLSSRNLPIVNDPIYGKPSKHFKNMGLYAKQIEFENPLSHQRIVVKDTKYCDSSFFHLY